MPPKKRDKEGETSKTQRSDAAKNDHDLFLQAFEKPTQIYRYLRVRNANSPIFLQRNLSYMQYRMSRSHKSRRNFEIDSILERVSKSLVPPALRAGFMTITFLGYYDKKTVPASEAPRDPVKVETLLLKICHKKRKDTTSPVMSVTVGTSIVPTNPSEESPPPKAPTVSISVNEFCEDQGEVKSYHLLLRVYNAPANGVNGTDQESAEPVSKRRRTSTGRDDIKLFGTDLVIYDKQKQCLLGDGDYELLMDEIVQPRNLPRKFPTWEAIGDLAELAPLQRLREFAVSEFMDCNSFELFANGPTLKFKLEWSREQRSSYVDRPRLMPGREEEVLDSNGNKENRQDRGVKKPSGDKKEEDKKSGKPVIVYQFHYNNNSRQQTEPCSDLHCPWCSLDCGSLFSLLKHLKLCHARFTFTYTPLPNMARVDVAINESYDGSYTGSPHDVIAQPGGSSFSRNGPQNRTSVSNILVCHPKRQKPSLSEFVELEEESGDLQRSFITGHNRLYHHTVTCLPVHPKEMENDSEDENDPKWLQTKTMMMIDEFTDVNEGEKELMKMWNLHVMKEGYVGDCQVPLACTKFLEKKGKDLLDKNLYRNFIVHMCSLFDYGLVSPVALYQTVQQLHEMVKDHHAKAMQGCWEAQKEHWIKSGAKEKQNTPSHFKNQAPSVLNGDPSARRKLYSPGSYKTESPIRKPQQEVDDEEEDEEEDEDYEDEDDEDENYKACNTKSSCSSSSGSSTSSDFISSKKKNVVSNSDPDKKKLASSKNGSVPSCINTQLKGQVILDKVQPTLAQKPSSNHNSKLQSTDLANGDLLKRKSSSRAPSPSPCLKPIPSQNNLKNLSGLSNEPPAKKKIVAQTNGKPQAVSSQLGTSVSSELKRKVSLSTGLTILPAGSPSVNESKKVVASGLSQPVACKSTSQGINDLKKRLSLSTMPTNGTKPQLNNVNSSAVQNYEFKKKTMSNGGSGVDLLTDGKLISNCTVEMSPIVEDIVSASVHKVLPSELNDVKRKSSLGSHPNGVPTDQAENALQRRKSLCTDSPAQDSSLVLLRRKSFSNNQSPESGPIQTVPAKSVTS